MLKTLHFLPPWACAGQFSLVLMGKMLNGNYALQT